MDYMSHTDALELVKLRIIEDGIRWSKAFSEYKQLTGMSTSAALDVGRYLSKKFPSKD